MNISRRSFLIGTAAVLAATQLPFATRVPTVAHWRRWLVGLDLYSDDWADGVMQAALFRNADVLPMFQIACTGQQYVRWIAAPAHEIRLGWSDLLRCEVSGGPPANLLLTCKDWASRDAKPVWLQEIHHFPGRDRAGSAEIRYLEPAEIQYLEAA